MTHPDRTAQDEPRAPRRTPAAVPLLLAATLALLLLAACGGGGDDSAALSLTSSSLTNPTCVDGKAYGPTPPTAGLDPLLAYQWHLDSPSLYDFSDTVPQAGSDIFPAGIFPAENGTGIKVAVVDSGLEIAHADLEPNVVPGCSFNFVTGTSDPTSTATDGDHGTSVAGLIAMRDDNATGGQGVAPRALLAGYNWILNQTNQTREASMGGVSWSADVDVFNQSFGFVVLEDFVIDATTESFYTGGVSTLRGGKGGIYVKSAGNGFDGYSVYGSGGLSNCGIFPDLSCENANSDPEHATPWLIVVGATDSNSIRASYSTAGSALWVSAPGGEFGMNSSPSFAGPGFGSDAYEPALVTTDQSGCAQGYSQTSPSPFTFNDFEDGEPILNPYCDYTSTFNGTSSAAPVTAGVVALMLQANPNLTWRDVKHILATTAVQIDNPSSAQVTLTLTNGNYIAEQDWITNAATPTAYKFHNWYGFGRVDGNAAVSAATTYAAGSWPALANTGWVGSGAVNAAIPDEDANGPSDVINVASSGIAFIEAVQVQLSVTHPFVYDLGIKLTSPGGTKSVLLNVGNNLMSPDLTGKILLSNAFYGEAADGNWTLEIVDGISPDAGTFGSWAIRVYGH